MEVSNEAWDLKETNGDDSLCREALTKDAAVEVVVGAARVDLFPRFSFGGDKSKGHLRKKKKDNSTIRHRSSMYTRHSAANNKDGSNGRKGSTNSYDSGSDNDNGKDNGSGNDNGKDFDNNNDHDKDNVQYNKTNGQSNQVNEHR